MSSALGDPGSSQALLSRQVDDLRQRGRFAVRGPYQVMAVMHAQCWDEIGVSIDGATAG
jgi:hypothetical protein